jgi:hypothetical protein
MPPTATRDELDAALHQRGFTGNAVAAPGSKSHAKSAGRRPAGEWCAAGRYWPVLDEYPAELCPSHATSQPDQMRKVVA